MKAGTVIPSNVVAATDDTHTQSVELMLFRSFSPGKRLNVTVYVEQLFRHGPLAHLHERAFSAFNGYGNEPTVIEELRDIAPQITDGANGILLHLQLEEQEPDSAMAATPHRKCTFSPPVAIKACSPRELLVSLALGYRGVHNDILYPESSVIHIPQFGLSRNLRVYIVVSDPETHAIVYSNGWSTPNFVGRNDPGGPLLVSATAPQGAFAPAVGGSGLSPHSPVPNTAIAPPPDVSGMYEGFTDPGHAIGRHIPCLLVQLNQAGRAVAGWFTRPPVNVGGPKHLRLNIPEPPELFRDVETAVLLGQYDGRFRFNWGLTDNLEADPVVDSLDGQASGLLEVQGKVLKMTVRRDDLQCTLYLHQQQPTSRWSSKAWQVLRARTLGALHERFTYDAFLGQIRPAPLAFWNQLGMDLCADGTLGKLIIEHYAVTGTERDVKRSKINTYLVALTSQERYRNVMVAQFFGKAGGIALEVNGKVQTVLAWLEKIQNDHLDEIDRTAKSRGEPLKTEQLLARADRGFVDLGIVHKHVYLYRIEFFPVGAKLPIKGWSIGAYAAPVTITRWVLKEGGGSEADDSRRDEEFGPPPRHALETFATFADVGIALEQEFKTNFDPKAKSSSSRPSQVVEFRSAHNLSREAFFGATFYTITGAVLSASVTSTASLGGGPKSMVMVLTANRGGVPVELVGGVDQWLTKPSLASQQFKPHNLSLSLTLFSLCLGWGCIGNPFQPAPVVRREGTLQSQDRTASVHGEVQGSFRVNSASLEGRSLAAVEEVLAIDRAMFVQDGGVATAAGHASPEGPDNQPLSKRRAEAILQAIRRAFGDKLAVEIVEAVGHGSELAQAEGMLKPPIKESDQVKYRHQLEREFKAYRFAVVEVHGVLTVRLHYGQSGSG